MSCLGTGAAPAVSICSPPTSKAFFRSASHTRPKSCRALGPVAGDRAVQLCATGSYSQVSFREADTPAPAAVEEDAALVTVPVPPPNIRILPADFS